MIEPDSACIGCIESLKPNTEMETQVEDTYLVRIFDEFDLGIGRWSSNHPQSRCNVVHDTSPAKPISQEAGGFEFIDFGACMELLERPSTIVEPNISSIDRASPVDGDGASILPGELIVIMIDEFDEKTVGRFPAGVAHPMVFVYLVSEKVRLQIWMVNVVRLHAPSRASRGAKSAPVKHPHQVSVIGRDQTNPKAKWQLPYRQQARRKTRISPWRDNCRRTLPGALYEGAAPESRRHPLPEPQVVL